MIAVFLCVGVAARRYPPIKISKALLDVAGRPVIEYLMDRRAERAMTIGRP